MDDEDRLPLTGRIGKDDAWAGAFNCYIIRCPYCTIVVCPRRNFDRVARLHHACDLAWCRVLFTRAYHDCRGGCRRRARQNRKRCGSICGNPVVACLRSCSAHAFLDLSHGMVQQTTCDGCHCICPVTTAGPSLSNKTLFVLS